MITNEEQPPGRRKNRVSLSIGLLVLTLAGFAVIVSSTSGARAQQPGEAISVLIPAAGNQPEPDPGPPTDMLVITGRSLGTVNVAGCGAGEHPLQMAILVDPDGGRASRRVEVININQGTPIPPGTRLLNFDFQTDCTIGGEAYKRYTAVVD